MPAAPLSLIFQKVRKQEAPDFNSVRNFLLVLRNVIVRVFFLRDLGRKKKQKGQRTSANGNHFLVRGAPIRIQPDLRFDYVVRVFITISK